MEIDQKNKIILHINSNQRVIPDDDILLPGSKPNESDFYINLDIPRDREYDSIVLLDAAIPKSYYMVISPGHNFIYLSEAAPRQKVYIDQGNYNITSFMSAVGSALTAQSVVNGNNYTYVLTYPDVSTYADTGHITITTDAPPGTTALGFLNEYGMSVQMGFFTTNYDGESITSYGFGDGGILTSNQVVNLQPAKSIYICCDAVSNGINNVLQAVQNQAVGTMNVATYQCTVLEAWTQSYVGNKDNLFHFQLVDEFLEPINLNGQEWSANLLLYKRQTLFDKIKSFIQYLTMKG